MLLSGLGCRPFELMRSSGRGTFWRSEGGAGTSDGEAATASRSLDTSADRPPPPPRERGARGGEFGGVSMRDGGANAAAGRAGSSAAAGIGRYI